MCVLFFYFFAFLGGGVADRALVMRGHGHAGWRPSCQLCLGAQSLLMVGQRVEAAGGRLTLSPLSLEHSGEGTVTWVIMCPGGVCLRAEGKLTPAAPLFLPCTWPCLGKGEEGPMDLSKPSLLPSGGQDCPSAQGDAGELGGLCAHLHPPGPALCFLSWGMGRLQAAQGPRAPPWRAWEE